MPHRPPFHRCLVLLALLLMAAAPLRAADTAAIDAALDALVQRHGLPGAVLRVARHGEPVYTRVVGRYSVDQRLLIASASKWVSAAVIARLVDQGVLDWDAPISRWASDLPADKAALTIRQLFALTSGLPGGDFTGAAPCLNQRSVTLEQCARQILALPLQGTPGTVFDYGGNSMQVAGWIAERASGTDFNVLLREQLGQPLGWNATGFGFLPGQDVGNPRVAGGLYSTAGEYLALLLALQSGGKAGGPRLWNAETLAEMERVQTTGTRVLSSPIATASYGIGHWIDLADSNGYSRISSSPGAFGFTPWLDRERGIAGVLAIDAGANGYGRTAADVRALVLLVSAAFGDAATVLPFADVGGVWWTPSEAGSGLLLASRADGQLAVSWYGFDASGAPLWLIGSGGWETTSRWRGQLFRARHDGGNPLRDGVIPEAVRSSAFADATLDFTDAGRGRFRLRGEGVDREVAIERFDF
ncbi:MAG: serine hydrolase domain-containing protein [Gemmatimonas sp.]|jgi:CubicO group peptidase (beta-lactamase class C family)